MIPSKDESDEADHPSYQAGPVDLGVSSWGRFWDHFWGLRAIWTVLVLLPFALVGYWKTGEVGNNLIKGVGFVLIGLLVWLDQRQKERAPNDWPHNNGLQPARSARSGPFAFRPWGQSLRAALAAEPGCCTGTGSVAV